MTTPKKIALCQEESFASTSDQVDAVKSERHTIQCPDLEVTPDHELPDMFESMIANASTAESST